MFHRALVRSVLNFKVNLIIKILILSDFFVWSSANLLSPVFAIYVVDKIPGASVESVGIATSLYLIVRSIMEIPVGIYIDKTKTEKDDLYSALIGTIASALVYFCYIFINSVWQLYALQIISGMAAALAFPGWYSIFTHHIDKEREGFEWSLYDVMLGVGMAATAALGAFLVEMFGFEMVFVLVGLLMTFGALLLLMIRKKIFLKNS